MTLVRLEHAALIGLAAVLPLLEAPKSILWLAWVLLWLANSWRARDFGGAWDRWDTLIALWIGGAVLGAALAGERGAEWRGTLDLMRYASALWVMKRARYPERVLNGLLAALAAGTLAALAWGYYGMLVSEERVLLGLKSVGHVNHSAIYLAIVFGATLVATRAWWRGAGAAWRIAGVVACVIFATSLFVMQSRAALGAAAVTALALLHIYTVRTRGSLHALAISAAVAAGVAVAASPVILDKNQVILERSGTLLAYRDGIWRAGLLAWREYPVFGVGMGNWGRIDADRLRRWSAARGEKLDEPAMAYASHGHSLYINALVERGLAGFALLAAVMVFWFMALRLPAANAPPVAWSCWGAAAAAWLVTAIVGLVNTTLHHEHALLSMLVLGAWLQLRRTRGA